MGTDVNRILIACCPVPDCVRTLMYSGDPKDKHTVILSVADKGYHGKTMMCPKSKTILKEIEKPKVQKATWQFP